MICGACSFANDGRAARCRSCGAALSRKTGAARNAQATHDASYESRIAEAESRLAALTEHIAAVEAERAAISDVLARARGSATTESAAVSALPRLAADLPVLTVGGLRVTFGGQSGTRVETNGVRSAPFAAVRPVVSSPAGPSTVTVRTDAERAAWETLRAGATVVRIVSGAGGGATTLLRRLAADAPIYGFCDGALTITDVRGPALDVGQRLAALVDAAPTRRYYYPTELQRLFSGMRALVLFDRTELTAQEYAELGELFPSLRFVIAHTTALPTVPTVERSGLAPDDVLPLLEAGYGRRIVGTERIAASNFCTSSDASPSYIRLIGHAARILGRSFISLQSNAIGADDLIRTWIAGLTPTDRCILSVVAFAPALLTAQSLIAIVGVDDVRTSLARLSAAELVRLNAGVYELPRAVEHFIPELPDAERVFERIVAVVGAEFDAQPAVRFDRPLAAAEMLVQSAFERSQWPGVLALAPRVAWRLGAYGAFGAWGRVLNLIAAAAKRVDAVAMLSLARHELGVRSLLLEEHHKATTFLRSAALDRERAGDLAGAALSRDVLALVDNGGIALPAAAAAQPRGTRIVAQTRSRPASQSARPAFSRRTLVALALTLAVVTLLGIAFWARPKTPPAIVEFAPQRTRIAVASATQLCVRATDASRLEIAPDIGQLPVDGQQCVAVAPAATTVYTAIATGPGGQEARRSVTVEVQPAFARQRVRIDAFTARPVHIRIGDSTRLCYAVVGADLLRIVPGVGQLGQLRACRTVTPLAARSYTYKLVAIGDNGEVLVRHVRVDVGPDPSRTPVAAVVATPIADRAPVPAPTARSVKRSVPPDGSLARRAVYQFDATPRAIERGQTASLCVGVDHWAHGFLTDIGTLPPGITRCYRVHPSATKVYRLHVAIDKSTAIETLTVAVRPPGHARAVAHDTSNAGQ